MIPVLGVPYINQPKYLESLIASIDEEIGQLVIIDNTFDGSAPQIPGAVTVSAHCNFGVAASWNLIIKSNPLAPWWLIVNSDIEFAPGDLAQIVEAMKTCDVITMHGFSIFAVSAKAIATVGFFDENFVPAYYEDDDWRYRCKLLGIAITDLALGATHRGSVAIRSDRWLMLENNRTFGENCSYFMGKWGGDKNLETFRTPFNGPCSPREWTLDISRLARMAWRRV